MTDSGENRELTEQERKERIEYHLTELKRLRATPRSDWHAGFEALLRIETHKYADLVHIRTEEEILRESGRKRMMPSGSITGYCAGW